MLTAHKADFLKTQTTLSKMESVRVLHLNGLT